MTYLFVALVVTGVLCFAKWMLWKAEREMWDENNERQ